MKTLFNIQVNPFKQEATITTKIKEVEYTRVISYESLDEWNSFEIDDKIYDIHFYYDAEFLVSIYPVENNKVDYQKPYKVKLFFKLTD